MKILLMGEFSSLHKYLKEGLIELGHEVTLVSSGDVWKKIGGVDIRLPDTSVGFKKYWDIFAEPIRIARMLKNYDVVQYINPTIFSTIVGPVVFDILKKQNGVISLVAAGDDYALIKSYLKGNFDYSPHDYDKSVVNKYRQDTIRGRMYARLCNHFEKGADIIIPSLYTYSFEHVGPTSQIVPFPINTGSIKYRDNEIKDGKIVFFHGLNRELMKGTPFIREALNRLKANYSNDVEVIIDGHMPFDKYMEVISKANVIVDQCCGYGYGINACVSMAQGKVVISGARQETLAALGVDSAPVIPARPSVDFLYEQMVSIIANRSMIKEMGYNSRRYIECLHDHKSVAQQYINIWNNCIKR